MAFAAFQAQGATYVPGTSDPWLAGMPNGSTASFNPGSGEPADVAPAQSPVLVTEIPILAGNSITWRATGTVGHPGDISGPDGVGLWTHYNGAENGISDIAVGIDSLLGVFLGPNQPNLMPAPSALDFSTQAARDYLTLAPGLQQVFFMGDGLTSGGDAQSIVVPAGATRLFLGTMDGYSWNNNNGEFEVTFTTSVPDGGSSAILLGLGSLGLWLLRRRQA